MLKKNSLLLFLMISLAAVLVWSFIHPLDRFTWVLEVSPSLLAVCIAGVMYKKGYVFSNLTYVILWFLIILTFIGGHYTYEKVPLFEWIQAKYHLKRNDYDRFGHFCKGALVLVFREILWKWVPIRKSIWNSAIAFSITLALAAFYEIAEWISSKLLGKATKDFVGLQGDIWDSEWDMSCVLISSLIILLLFSKRHDRYLKKSR